MTITPKPKVSIHRDYATNAQRLWTAWTDTRSLSDWLGRVNPSETVVRVTADVRVGGSFSFIMRRHGVDIDQFGDYITVDEPRRLEFSWMGRAANPHASRVAIAIAERGGVSCSLTIEHTLQQPMQTADSIAGSWYRMMAAIANALG